MTGTTVFETAPFNHSGTPPKRKFEKFKFQTPSHKLETRNINLNVACIRAEMSKNGLFAKNGG
jgi:hypothetical protein